MKNKRMQVEWILRTDASALAVGAVLVQVIIQDDGSVIHQPIAFASKKFSDQALKWDTYKKEAYACYFGVRSFSYYLRGKSFILETDHRNLQWIENSEASIVIRWRAYMQSFVFLLRHIPGTRNLVADWMSRMYHILNADEGYSDSILLSQADSLNLLMEIMLDSSHNMSHHLSLVFSQSISEISERDPKYYISQVHGGRNLHLGARRTWNSLNKLFPGHKIPYREIADFVATCPVCQKLRLQMTDNIQPIRRHLKPPNHRK